jgi:hypothetical protein
MNESSKHSIYAAWRRAMDKIPDFPDFAPIDMPLRPELEAFTKNFPAYSDFNFVSLYSWNTANDMSASWLHSNLVLECSDYTSADTYYSFMGDAAIDKTARQLLEYAAGKGYAPELKFVPEVCAQTLLDKPEYIVTEDPDNHDYLLSVPELAVLKGNRHSHTREAVNRFLRDHREAASFTECNLHDPTIHEQLYTIFHTREAVKTNDSAKELLALERSLHHVADTALRGFGVFIADELQAFITCEQLDTTTAIAHFSKANTAIKGIYQYLMHQLGKTLDTEHMQTLNIEQDLGD